MQQPPPNTLVLGGERLMFAVELLPGNQLRVYLGDRARAPQLVVPSISALAVQLRTLHPTMMPGEILETSRQYLANNPGMWGESSTPAGLIVPPGVLQ